MMRRGALRRRKCDGNESIRGRKKGRPKRKSLDKVKEDIKEKGLRLMKCMIVLHGDMYVIVHRPHIKVGKRCSRRRGEDS